MPPSVVYTQILKPKSYTYCKIDIPYSLTFVTKTLVLEWYVIRCGFKNKNQKDTCLRGIGFHAQITLASQGSRVNLIGVGGVGSYVTIERA